MGDSIPKTYDNHPERTMQQVLRLFAERNGRPQDFGGIAALVRSRDSQEATTARTRSTAEPRSPSARRRRSCSIRSAASTRLHPGRQGLFETQKEGCRSGPFPGCRIRFLGVEPALVLPFNLGPGRRITSGWLCLIWILGDLMCCVSLIERARIAPSSYLMTLMQQGS
jgi:hypothetical protein